jgi:hypothetical protein
MPRTLIVLAFALGLAPVIAAGQTARQALIDQTVANHHGLKRAWFTHIEVGGGRAPIVDIKFDGGTLFVQTGMATTHAIDGETGRTLWTSEVGSPSHPSLPLGIGEKQLAAVNGTTLYVLDRATGQVVFTRRTVGVPLAGGTLSETAVFVPNISGQIETYSIVEEDHRNIANLRMEGRDLTQPVASTLGVAWGSGRGDFGLASLGGTALIFRFPTNFGFHASPAARGRDIYAGNLGGMLYAFADISGAERWSFAAGSAIRPSPVPFADAVYVLCEDLSMFRVSAETGREEWMARNIRQFLATSPTRVYTIDRLRRLAVLNAKSGAVIDLVSLAPEVFPITNSHSDQIFLATDTGLIQSLHEIELTRRLDYRAPKEEPPPQESAETKAKAKSGKSTKADGKTAPAEPPATKAPAPAPMPPAGDPFGPAPIPDAKADPFGPAR